MVGDQRVRAAAQLIPVACDFAGALDAGVEAVLELLLLDGGGEDQRLTRFEARLEPAGDQQVLAAVVAAAVLVGVRHALVPVGVLREGGALVAHLHAQVGETLVQAVGHAARNLLAGGVGLGILLRQVMDVAERQIGTELEDDRAGCFEDFEFHEHLVTVRRQDESLAEEDVSHLAGDLRDGVRAEVHHVLVAARFIGIPVTVDAQVELLAVHDQGFVQVGKEQELVAAETVQRDREQAVVTARVAGDDGRVAVGSRLVGAQDLTLERVGQVDQFRLVEFQECHIVFFYLIFFNTSATRLGR